MLMIVDCSGVVVSNTAAILVITPVMIGVVLGLSTDVADGAVV